MKTRIIIFLSFLTNSIFAQEFIPIDTVEIECRYTYKFQENATSETSFKIQEMSLLLGRSMSEFTATHKLYSDSLLFARNGQKFTPESFSKFQQQVQGTQIHAYCNNYIYKNYPQHGDILFISYLDHTYPYIHDQRTMKWEITQNADTTILHYKCKKAKTFFAGRTYIAWFTLDIPISDGPYKFCGLPGLIVNVEDSQKQHCFILTSVKKLANASVIYLKKTNFLEMTASDYVKALNANTLRMANLVKSLDDSTPLQQETKAQSIQKLKGRNNFIEIYE